MITINGKRAIQSLIRVPYAGVWMAVVELESDDPLPGSVEIKLGALSLRGVAVQHFTGTFGAKTTARIAGGAGGFAKILPPKHYHNDAGVKTSLVVSDAIREAGETLGAAQYPATTLGIDFVRASGPASRVLDQALGRAAWWVGLDGVTRVGPRPQREIVGEYDMLEFDPTHRVATLATDDPSIVEIGSVVRRRISPPLIVREMEYSENSGAFRIMVWGKS